MPLRETTAWLDESLNNLKMHCAVNQDRLYAMHGSGMVLCLSDAPW